MGENSQEDEYSPEKFAIKSIYSNDDSFVCLICNEQILPSESIHEHIRAGDHCNKFEKISTSYTKINDRIACKLCSDYRALEWKDFLIHFHEKNHSADPAAKASSPNLDISYAILFNNQIIEPKPGEYHCCSCKMKKIVGRKLIDAHIFEEEHKKLQEIRNKDHLIEQQLESDCQKFVKNSIWTSKNSIYHCYTCNCSVNGLKNISEHIGGINHDRNSIEKRNIHNRSLRAKISANQNQIEPRNLPENMSKESSTKSMKKSKRSPQNCDLSNNTLSSCISSKNDSNNSGIIHTTSSKSALEGPRQSKIPQNLGPKNFAIRGIFATGNSFVCLICQKPSLQFQSITLHMCTVTHCINYEKIMANCTKINEKFACKLCTNHLHMEWKDYLIHFHDNKHFKNLPEYITSKRFDVTYDTLLDNQIIETKPGVYSCCSCNKKIVKRDLINAHIVGKKHKHFQEIRNKHFGIANRSESDCRKLVKNWFSALTATIFYCFLCNVPVEGLSACYEHISSLIHVSELMRADNTDQQSLTKTVDVKQNKIRSYKLPGNMTKESFLKLISENSITRSLKTGKYKCNLCICMLTGPATVPQHVSSRKHKQLRNANRIEEKSTNRSESSSNLETTESYSSASWDTYESLWRSYDSSENLLGSWEASETASNSWETISPTNPYSAVQRPPLQFEIDQNLIPLMSKKLLEHRKKEIYCIPCGAYLRDEQSLSGHTESKNHYAKLISYKTQNRQKDKKNLLSTSKKSSITNSPINKINNQLSKLSINKTTKPKDVQPSKTVSQTLFEVPKKWLNLIKQHSLQHLKNEVYCPNCDVHLNNLPALISHTNSKRHVDKLNMSRAQEKKKDEKPSAIPNNISITDSLVNATSNKPTQSVTKIVEKEDPQSTLLQISHELILPIKKHMLQHSSNQTCYEFCESQMKNYQKLIDKTKKGNEISNKQLENIPNKLTTIEPKSENVAKGNSNETLNKNIVNNSKILKNSKKLAQNKSTKPKFTKPPAKRIKRRNFDPKYLEDNMQHIYKFNPETLRIIKLSCQLCFPTESNTFHCLTCGKSIANTLQTFYEHIRCSSHIAYLAAAERNDNHFIEYPDQFSDLKLAKEFMQESSNGTIQCYPCDKLIKNDDAIILEHIKEDSHNAKKQPWKEAMKKIEQAILLQMESTWYNIQKYWCCLCDIEFRAEFLFAEHLESKKHESRMDKIDSMGNKVVYDSCTSCAALWLGSSGVYTEHCQQPLHKYLVRSGDYSKFALLPQARALLEQAETEVKRLIKLSNKVLTVEKQKAESLLRCLEDTVKPEFPDAKAHPFGSRVSGLGFPDSDIDVFLDCGTYNGDENLKNHQRQIIKSVASLLSADEESWEIDEIVESSRTPIIKLRHRATELSCDVSFKNGLSVENTRLIKLYIDKFPLCRKLMLFLKKWLSLCNLSGSQYISNYAICWYVIFYLQDKKILPSVGSLIAKKNESHMIDNWETGVCDKFNVDQQKFTFTELLYEFFIFYNNFDFRNSVACPLLGKAIPKEDFTDLDRLPEEMTPYVNHVNNNSSDGSVELFRIDSEMCIQDPYDLSHNLTKTVQKFTLFRFRRLSACSTEILKPSLVKN